MPFYIRDIIACFIATFMYCIIMYLPKKALVVSSLSATVTYIIFRLIYVEADAEPLGYLVSSVFAAISAEVLARTCKMPVTIFVIPAIVPLVPGVGLYRSMLCLVRNDMSGFASAGTRTLFISGIIAVTVAVVNASFKNFFKKKTVCK